jgi:hypothetical protein
MINTSFSLVEMCFSVFFSEEECENPSVFTGRNGIFHKRPAETLGLTIKSLDGPCLSVFNLLGRCFMLLQK